MRESPFSHSRRGGFNLVEVITVLVMLSAFLVVLMPVWPLVLSDVPATQRAANTHRQLAGALQRIGRDMDRAIDLPAGEGDANTGAERPAGQTLRIRTAEGTIVYEWGHGVLTRSELGSQAAPQTWQMPGAVIRWRKLSDLAAVGIEVRTAVEVRIGPRLVEKLAGADVFYVGGLGPRAAPEEHP